MILSLQNVETFYGNIQALRGVSLEVNAGEIVALIGANGAGKSTLLMTICGHPQPRRGSVKFKGKELVGQTTYQIMRHGIAQVPEGRRIFPKMSVLENLAIGATLADHKHYAKDLQEVFDIFPILAKRQSQRAGTLSGGEQQMLAIGRALMSRPELLLLDEPSLGIAPLIIKQIFNTIKMLNRERGMTILLIEQNALQALKIAHRGYVLQQGEIVMTGAADQIMSDPRVQAAYLGTGG
ncbi:MAG: ABC transporter ATP-binding protein [Candidatus Pacebacteria bacterium]|nr:ABC transporter ATP-binding protein [Candidatus Paceibacterota bacterium]